jgi:peptidoglycan DL-endopeptidase CwlO
VATHRTRSIRTTLAVVCSAVVAVGLLASTGEAQPKPTLAAVQKQIAALDVQAETAQETLNSDQVAVAAAEKILQQINARVARSAQAVAAAKVSVGRLASAAYRSGGVDQTLQLILADNPTQFLDQASALDGVSRRQGNVLRTVAAAQNRLAQDRLAAAQELGQIQALRDSAAKAYADVKAKQAAAVALFNSLSAADRAAIQAAQKQRSDAARAAAARAAAAHRPTRHGGRIPTGGGSGIGASVVAFAMAQVGDSYVFGATGMSSWDCSGLTMRAYASVGIYLPHSSRAQFGSGRHISYGSLQPGDLVFFYSPIHHVGIYIGGGMIVHAANPSDGVTTAPLSSMPFSGAVRPY